MIMTIADFFNTWPGMFLAQSFLHSLVAALLVDTALLAWKIENPAVRLPFRLMVIATPILSFPLFQLATPERGSAAFRLDALFDLNRWLNLGIWGPFSVGMLFLLFLGFAAAVFVLQEMIPIARHAAAAGEEDLDAAPPEPGTAVARAIDEIPGKHAPVLVIDDEEPVVFSSTGREPAIFLSSGLAEALTQEELKAAIAHEIGHIARSRRPVMVAVFLLRMLMFYNPVILMEFRRIVQEEEKICDDVAVRLTGSRAAVAGALRKFYYQDDRSGDPLPGADTRFRDRLEEFSHSLLIESRIARLEEDPPPPAGGIAPAFIMTLLTIAGINYFLV